MFWKLWPGVGTLGGPLSLPRDPPETCCSSALLGTRTAAFSLPAWIQMLLLLPLVGPYEPPRPLKDNLGSPRKASFNRTRASEMALWLHAALNILEPINCIFQKGECVPCGLSPYLLGRLPCGQPSLTPRGRLAEPLGFRKVALPGPLSSYRGPLPNRAHWANFYSFFQF